MVIYTRIPNR
uniref:Uncharacterized protein n=1 Tax=Lepeophtheirus salmonis TaxID=72036 RepID=A0A0K2UK76_LEPSM